MTPEQHALEEAARRHGLVTRDAAFVAGMTRGALRQRVESGRWVEVHDGVYRVRGAPETWDQKLLAAVLAAGPLAAVSHRSAAIKWDLDGLGGRLVEVSVPYSRGMPPLDGVLVHRSLDLAPGWVTTRNGIPVTIPVRTLVDLGAVAPAFVVERAFTSAHGKKLLTMASARSALDALARRGRRGVGPFRAILEARCDFDDPAGWLESELGLVLATCDLPRPVAEFDIYHEGRRLGRADQAYPEVRLLVEGNGFETHGTFEGFTRDHVRRNDLAMAGWERLEFTRNQVVHQPGYVRRTTERVYWQRHAFFEALWSPDNQNASKNGEWGVA